MMHTVRGAAWLVIASMLLSACKGGGDSGSGSATPPTSSPPPTTTTPPAPNKAPVISIQSESTVLIGRELKLRPTASDPDGQSLSFTIANKPSWLSFSAQTGEIAGTPGAADVGTYTDIRITASDGQAQATAAATIAVVASAPGRATLSWDAPSQRTDGTPLTDLGGFRIYFGTSTGDLRYVVDIKDAGARSWVVEDLTPGTWYFAATAFDAAGIESSRTNPASKTIT